MSKTYMAMGASHFASHQHRVDSTEPPFTTFNDCTTSDRVSPHSFDCFFPTVVIDYTILSTAIKNILKTTAALDFPSFMNMYFWVGQFFLYTDLACAARSLGFRGGISVCMLGSAYVGNLGVFFLVFFGVSERVSLFIRMRAVRLNQQHRFEEQKLKVFER